MGRASVDIDKEGKSVRIKLSKDFYDMDSIRKAMEDFSGLCSATINREGLEIVLTTKGKSDVKTLGYEFCNYVLALMKNNNIV